MTPARGPQTVSTLAFAVVVFAIILNGIRSGSPQNTEIEINKLIIVLSKVDRVCRALFAKFYQSMTDLPTRRESEAHLVSCYRGRGILSESGTI